ncbi:hypothetical protein GCK72_014512 [Caenorhabditis remanei]|uniref:Uncharacterized protein n=1 Tax=Caenorhabditis remanei TaxID=31234 RepID=A0A6A5GTR8_CAERE|nr:hypothetical protein GCK72_014512 [Caenorhabditis remanei]KAF1758054.1 hypothetical protein GCK72_014512 [Caenorhabditis remanei]
MRLILLLVAVVLIAFIDGASGEEFELKVEAKEECDAGEKTDQNLKINGRQTIGNKKYRIVEAYIYWTNSNGKVIGSTACNVPGSKKCVALNPSPKNAARRYLVVAVTLNKSSFEDQNIHYQYFDELFQLSKIPDPKKLPTADIHNLNNFLYIANASYTTSAETLRFTGINCRENRAKSLISGHGYFITEFGGKGAWDNLYFLPQNGQYITTPN